MSRRAFIIYELLITYKLEILICIYIQKVIYKFMLPYIVYIYLYYVHIKINLEYGKNHMILSGDGKQ